VVAVAGGGVAVSARAGAERSAETTSGEAAKRANFKVDRMIPILLELT
jgi:hypothetical protein